MTTQPEIKAIVLDIDGVITDGRLILSEDGKEMKQLCYRDIDAVFKAHRLNFKIAIITGEDSLWVDCLVQKLKIEHVIKGAKDKGKAIAALANLTGIPVSSMCYVGDGDRDVPALLAAGIGLVPKNASSSARTAALKILNSNGGDGAVAEALEYCLAFNQSLSEL